MVEFDDKYQKIIIAIVPLIVWVIHFKFGILGGLPMAIISGFLTCFLLLLYRAKHDGKTPDYKKMAKISSIMAGIFGLMIMIMFGAGLFSFGIATRVVRSPLIAIITGVLSGVVAYPLLLKMSYTM